MTGLGAGLGLAVLLAFGPPAAGDPVPSGTGPAGAPSVAPAAADAPAAAPAPAATPAPAAAPAAAAAPAPAGEPGKVVSEGDVAIRASVAPDPSNVGDILTLEVVVAYPRGYTVNLPTALEFAPLHLVETVDAEPEPTGQGLRKTFEIRLQHFAVGPARVPSFPITYVTAEGEVHTLHVPPVELTVESLLANENDPVRKGEDPPISIEYPNDLAETIAWSVLGTLVFAFAVWLLLRRYLARPKVAPAPTPIPPHEVAFAALDELEGGELLANERWADYYLELTEIAKGYVEGRFGVPALDRTTDEIRRDLVRDPKRVAPLTGPEVVDLLQRFDLVKFARFAPPRDEATADLGEMRRIVERSLPTAPPAPEQAPEPPAEPPAERPAEPPAAPKAPQEDP